MRKVTFIFGLLAGAIIKLGVVFRKEPAKTEWGIETVFEDTCGNLIQLHQD